MALDNQFGKGIGVAAGFDLGAQKPLDARVAVNTIAERDAHVENNRAYEGMLVYVAEANMTYQLVKGEEEGQLVWKEFGFNQADFDESFNGAIQDVDDRLKAVEEDLAQGGEIEARIAQNESDIDGLQGLVGQPAQAGEGEEEGVPATGLHLALDNAKAELEQDILDEKGRAEGQEAAIRQELADEASEIRQEMADELGNYTVEAAEGVEGKEASGLRKEIEDAHKAMDQAMEQAHNEMNQAMQNAVNGEKERAEGQEAAIRQEMAAEAQRVDKKIADDIKAEHDLRVAEEQRIEGKIDAEAQRADAEEKRIVGLVEAEAEAARAAELKLTQDLAKEVEDRGKAVKDLSDKHDQEMEAAAEQVGKDLAALKQELQGEIDGDVAAEAKLREDADKALDERVKPLEAHVAAQPSVDAEQDRRIKALEDDAPVKQAAIEAAQAAADQAQSEVDLVEGRALALEGRAEALEEDVARLDGAVDVEGSVKKQIKDAVDAINADAEALEARVKANEDDIVEMKAEEAKIREDFVKADEEVLAAAKKHADDAITDLVDSAPDAMNTLNELAKAINDNKGIYDAWVVEHNQAMANMKEELQGEIDADVKVVADELAKQKDTEQVGTLANQIKVEKGRAEGVEAAIRGEMEVEAARVNKKIADDIKAEHDLRVAEEQRIEQECEAAMAQEVKDRNAAIKVEEERAVAKEGELLAAINQEVQDRKDAVSGEASARQQADEAIGGRLDKLEAKVDVDGKSVADQIADLKSELEDKMEDAAEAQLEKDNAQDKALTDAIAKEVEDRNAAIKVVSDELVKQKDPTQEGTLAKQIADEVVRAKAEEADIRADFAAEDQKLQAAIDLMKNADVEGTLANLIAALRSDLTAHLTTVAFDGDQPYDDLAPLA